MRFMMLMLPGDYENAAPDTEALVAMMKYNDTLRDAGVLLSVNGLHPPSTGARVSFTGGEPTVTDGPFIDAAEVLGGYWLIEVASRDEAIAWAKRCPAGDHEVIEVRRVQAFEDFPADIRAALSGKVSG